MNSVDLRSSAKACVPAPLPVAACSLAERSSHSVELNFEQDGAGKGDPRQYFLMEVRCY